MTKETVFYTRKEFFLEQAPAFNFELNADQLVAKGLEVGFITEVSAGVYERTSEYKSS
jgi:hypothetical protein